MKRWIWPLLFLCCVGAAIAYYRSGSKTTAPAEAPPLGEAVPQAIAPVPQVPAPAEDAIPSGGPLDGNISPKGATGVPGARSNNGGPGTPPPPTNAPPAFEPPSQTNPFPNTPQENFYPPPPDPFGYQPIPPPPNFPDYNNPDQPPPPVPFPEQGGAGLPDDEINNFQAIPPPVPIPNGGEFQD